MGLFQRQPVITSAPLYTVGDTKQLLIVGLGNIGKQYQQTRHNIGFGVLDIFAKANDFPGWTEKKDLKSLITSLRLGSNQVILAKPTTFMNDSGQAVVAVQHFWRIPNDQTLVVYDELALPFGSLRSRRGGGAAGHNGIKSLISHIGDDFGRLRLGIGSEISAKARDSDFVLGKFTDEEKENLPLIMQEAAAMLNEYIFGGELPLDTRTII